MKACSKCKIEKDLEMFPRRSAGSSSRKSWCKKCYAKHHKAYCRTKGGLIRRIYLTQVGNSKKRGHELPKYTLDYLIGFCVGSEIFNKLFDEWVESGYLTDLSPSIDRIYDNIGYEIGNIQIMTWGENNRKHYDDIKSGVTTPQAKRVDKLSMDGELLRSYDSIAIAARDSGAHGSLIGKCCRGERRYTAGFKWRYSGDEK